MYETTLTAFGNASYIHDSGERCMFLLFIYYHIHLHQCSSTEVSPSNSKEVHVV